MIRVYLDSAFDTATGKTSHETVEYATATNFETDGGELAIVRVDAAGDGKLLAVYAPECWERVELVEPQPVEPKPN